MSGTSERRAASAAGAASSRRFAFGAAALLCGVAAAVLLGEAAVRLAGEKPFHTRRRPATSFLQPDPVLGWKPSPGAHKVEYRPLKLPVAVTILDDGSRATAPAAVDGPEVLLLGGSYTFGYGLPDQDTLGWRLQQRDPGRRYVNRAVTAYGAYQSLLALEDRLQQGAKPAAVVYGYIGHHDVRNIAYGSWPSYLTASGRGAILPYCDVASDGSLLRLPPLRNSPLPGRKLSALINVVDRGRAVATSRGRLSRKSQVRDALFRELRDAAERAGARFTVFLVDTEHGGDEAAEALDRLGIPYLDLRRDPSPDIQLTPTNPHPNARLTAAWAEEAAPFLKQLLGD